MQQIHALRAQVKAAVLEEDLALGRHLIEQLKGRGTWAIPFLALWPTRQMD